MIKLAKPYIPEKGIEDVASVLRSGNLVQGEYVLQFETKLKDYLNINHAILVSSGTAALHLALIAMGIKAGDEVIVPAFTFPATANVIELIGAKAVFVDISLDDFCIGPLKIEKAITGKTKAIIPVHEFGQSAKINDIAEIARKYDLKVIEDAACALGTEYNQQKVGTFGDIGCFSFHPRKAITTGEGGLLITRDEELANKLTQLRNHGITSTQGKIDFIEAGLNYRLTDFQAALGISQIEIMDSIISQRIEQASVYFDELKDYPLLKLPKVFEERKMVFQTFHILLDDRVDRDKLKQLLFENGIETNFGAYALNCTTYYKNKYNLSDDDFSNAYKAYKQGLALPMGHHLTKKEIVDVSNSLKQIINGFF